MLLLLIELTSNHMLCLFFQRRTVKHFRFVIYLY